MENPHVYISTNEGDILVELFADKAPKSVENFLRYVDEGHYDETIFHRVIRKFMIQGGGYTRKLVRKDTHAPIPNEAKNGLTHVKGTIAMARGPEKDSATDQFFINAADNPDLDHCGESDEEYGYAVFGQVVDGMNVVKKINWKVVEERDGFPSIPVDMMVIGSISRFE